MAQLYKPLWPTQTRECHIPMTAILKKDEGFHLKNQAEILFRKFYTFGLYPRILEFSVRRFYREAKIILM